ncbi:hypothetical protein N7478_010570 [Penicillium angulare]|uniref:uncharacterized protein n=1 Tax=Penicillium angulare TaxID=116970 RepID=UPI00254231D9|nr:uncharacterized protein N7478_010570 [Penicillium angulare]KAJ5267762.1 hypothetical protein N7478_010570 [Penicillium angulare]
MQEESQARRMGAYLYPSGRGASSFAWIKSGKLQEEKRHTSKQFSALKQHGYLPVVSKQEQQRANDKNLARIKIQVECGQHATKKVEEPPVETPEFIH